MNHFKRQILSSNEELRDKIYVLISHHDNNCELKDYTEELLNYNQWIEYKLDRNSLTYKKQKICTKLQMQRKKFAE